MQLKAVSNKKTTFPGIAERKLIIFPRSSLDSLVLLLSMDPDDSLTLASTVCVNRVDPVNQSAPITKPQSSFHSFPIPALKRIAEIDSSPEALSPVLWLVTVTYIFESMELRAKIELKKLP